MLNLEGIVKRMGGAREVCVWVGYVCERGEKEKRMSEGIEGKR